MQAAAKQQVSAGANGAGAPDPSDSDYVGKHRPHRMSLLHSRVRVDKPADRGTGQQSR